MPESIEPAEIVKQQKKGGQVLNAIIVERTEGGCVIYVRVSWTRGRAFRLLGTWRGKSGDRTFQHVESAVRLVRRMGINTKICVYREDDPELALVAAVGGGRDRQREPDHDAAGSDEPS